MELRKKFLAVASLTFALALSAGVAVAAGAEGDVNWTEDFAISATSIRLDDASKEGEDSGIRFWVDCPVDYSANADVKAYTTLTFKSSVVTTANPNGDLVQYSIDVPAKVWRDATGWNTVLLNVPSTDYTTDITAQSFVVIDANTTYQTMAQTTSIAKVAATLMADGETREEVTKYAANAVNSIELPATAVIETVGATTKLTATTDPAGYAVVWSSSNADVATVAADGTVTATGIGKATITATMSGKTATCEVAVGDKWVRENNVTVYGATISNKQAVVLKKGATNDGKWWASEADEIDMGYVAFNGSYGVGDFVAFDFTGNNMPYITLAAKTVNKNYTNKVAGNNFEVGDKTDTGVFVWNGYSSTQGEISEKAHAKRLEVYGPYKQQNVGLDPFKAMGANVGVGMYELQGSTDKFRMIVGIESMSTTQIQVGAVVYNLTQNTQPVFNSATINVSNSGLTDVFEGSIILHGRLGMETAIDKLYPVYENTEKGKVRDAIAALPAPLPEWAEEAGLTAYGATVNEDQSVVLKKGTTDGEWWASGANEIDVGYLAFNGSYGVGDFVAFEFTGNNMPYITLAAKNVNKDYSNKVAGGNSNVKDKTDTGVFVWNGYSSTQGEISDKVHAQRIEAYGPYKQQYVGVGNYASTGANVGVGMYELQGSTDKFRMIVGIESMTTTEIKVGVVIVNLTARENGDTSKQQPVYGAITINITSANLANVFEGSIILHGRLGLETKIDKVYSIFENTNMGTVKWSLPGSNF